jgi:hypothetical protein
MCKVSSHGHKTLLREPLSSRFRRAEKDGYQIGSDVLTPNQSKRERSSMTMRRFVIFGVVSSGSIALLFCYPNAGPSYGALAAICGSGGWATMILSARIRL